MPLNANIEQEEYEPDPMTQPMSPREIPPAVWQQVIGHLDQYVQQWAADFDKYLSEGGQAQDDFDPSKHKRGGNQENTGQFSKGAGGGKSESSEHKESSGQGAEGGQRASSEMGERIANLKVSTNPLGHGYSPSAKLVDGVIHTDNVHDAVRALWQGRKVQLKQPHQISTLVQELGKVNARVLKAGQKPPVFDLCNVTVENSNLFCAESLGIPRIEMPQFTEEQLKAFTEKLVSEGHQISHVKEYAPYLRATQSELNGGKIAKGVKWLQGNPQGREREIIISGDNYVLDGHHHWAAMVTLDTMNQQNSSKTMINAVKINIGITDLLQKSWEFVGGRGVGGKGVGDARPFSARARRARDEGGRFNNRTGLAGANKRGFAHTPQPVYPAQDFFQESEHPRDKTGEFTDKGGGHGGRSETDAGTSGGSGRGQPGGTERLEAAQREAKEAAGDRQALAGLPQKPIVLKNGDAFVPGPIDFVHKAAEAYMYDADLVYIPPRTYSKLNKERAARIATAFDAMEHDPHDPKVRASYNAMIKETLAQYQQIKKLGIEVEFIKPDMDDPYAETPRLAVKDVRDNKHYWVFPTDTGFGTEGGDPTMKAEAARIDNPLLEWTDETDANGNRMRANDVFRVVHDFFGHFKDGNGFRAEGEENAWRSHSAMYSDLARPAMTSETRGQNSWVNYGPYGDTNRTAKADETHFAPQKIGLLPDWVYDDGRFDAEGSVPERIGAAAVRIHNGGRVFTGDDHFEATRMAATSLGRNLNEMSRELLQTHKEPRTFESGFITNTGRFVDRREANKIAQAAKQLTSKADYSKRTGELDSTEVKELAGIYGDEWQESKHPRDKTGEFATSGSGGASGRAAPISIHGTLPDEQERARMRVMSSQVGAVAAGLHFNPDDISVSNEDKQFTLNGKTLNYAGMANKNTGMCTIYSKYNNYQTVAAVTAHEVMHQKTWRFFDRYGKERDRMFEALKKFDDEHGRVSRLEEPMKADGLLREPWASQFPTYQRYQEITKEWDKLAESDGVTAYSREWWDAAKKGEAGFDQAAWETLSEMAALHMQNRKLGHTGSKQWRDLYRLINDDWEQGRESEGEFPSSYEGPAKHSSEKPFYEGPRVDLEELKRRQEHLHDKPE